MGRCGWRPDELELGGYLGGLAEYPPVGDVDHPQAAHLQPEGLPLIGLPGLASAVPAPAVGLDDQAEVAPEKVGPVRTDPGLDLGTPDPEAIAEAQELIFEVALGQALGEGVVLE